jgi:hypothetical protein
MSFKISIMKKNILFRSLVLITSMTQIISPVLSTFTGNERQNTNPQITPAGYTFGIWGVITLLAFMYGIFQILPKRKNEELHLAIAPKLIITYLLFSLWLFAAQKEWLIITVIVFVSMFLILRSIFEKIISHKNNFSLFEKIVLEGQVGLYLGWSTVAIFANLASAIKFYGTADVGIFGVIWQALILSLALINAMFGIYKFQFNYIYIGTILWAFVGIFFGLNDEVSKSILQPIVISLIIILLIFLYKFRSKMYIQIIEKSS